MNPIDTRQATRAVTHQGREVVSATVITESIAERRGRPQAQRGASVLASPAMGIQDTLGKLLRAATGDITAMGQLADLKDGMVNRPLAAMAMLAVFLAPGASTLYVASQKVMPSWVINSAIWNGLIIPHATLVLVALAALLCVSRPTAAEQALSRPRGA